MTGQEAALYTVSATAAASGLALAVRSRKHAPLALLLAFGLASDVLVRAQPACRPLLYLYPWAALLGADAILGAGRRARLVVGALSLYLVALVLLTLSPIVPLAIAQVGIAVVLAAIVEQWRERTRRPASATEVCAIVCAVTEIAQVPAYLGLPGWTSARAVYALAFVTLTAIQSHATLAGSRCPPSAPST